MARVFVYLLLQSLSVGFLAAQTGALDPEFEKIPFEKWLGEPDQLHFHWSVRSSRAELSFHQRLSSSVDIKLDGRDLDNRRHNGKLLLFTQITDSHGAHFQEHGEIALDKLDANVKDAYINYSQRAFFLPGDYHAAVALQDEATGEHATSQLQFRVNTPQHFWLADFWLSMPPVEFIGDDVSPESWYLPYIQGHVQWAAPVQSPAQLDVVLNVSPSTRPSAGSLAESLPSLKVIAFPGSPVVSERIALMDLSRRKTVFEQTDTDGLDWHRLKSSLEQSSTASIDVHSLSGRQQNAQFFVSEVRRILRAAPADKTCVLVVLSAPVSFEAGEDMEPISLEALPSCQVIYVRYHTPHPIPALAPPTVGLSRRSRMNGPRMTSGEMGEPFDQLASTLKPLNPKVIDVETAGEFSKALLDIQRLLAKPR